MKRKSIHYPILTFLFVLLANDGLAIIDTVAFKFAGKEFQKHLRQNMDSAQYYAEQLLELTASDPISVSRAQAISSYGEFRRLAGKDSVFYYQEKAANIYKELGNDKLYARSMGPLGQAFKNQGEYEKAIEYLNVCLNYAQKAKDSIVVAVTLDNLGDATRLLARNDESLDYYFKAAKLFKKLGFTGNYASNLNSIGLIYRVEGKHEKEIEYFKKSIEALEDTNEPVRKGNAHLNLATAYSAKNQDSKAIQHFQHAMSLYDSANYEVGKTFVYNGFSSFYESKNDYKKSLEYALKNIELATKHNMLVQLADAYSHAGKCYGELDQLENAIVYFKKAYELDRKGGRLNRSNSWAKQLATIYEAKQNHREALKYFRLHASESDSLVNKENIEKFKEVELNYAYNQQRMVDSLKVAKEKETIALKHEQDLLREKQSQNVLFFALLLIAVIAIFSFIAFKRKQKQEVALKEKNDVIEKALNEKQLLLKEINHRVKNNFQIVSSLLEIQSKGIEDEKALKLAQEGRERINSMALIHQRLYQNDDLLIHFQEYMEKLVGELQYIYGGKETKVNLDVPDLTFDIDTAIPLGLIVNELVSNAFKYGFKGEGNQELNVQLNKEQDGTYKLKVQDNGVGVPEGFNVEKAKSLGLRLVRRLSKQLHGSMTYANEDGCTFTVLFKDTNARAAVL